MNDRMDGIQRDVISLGAMINVPPDLLVIKTKPSSDGVPFLTYNDNIFVYSSIERDYEIFKKITSSEDEVLYWILSRAVSRMVLDLSDSEFGYSVKSEENMFARKVDLLKQLKPAWGSRAAYEYRSEMGA
ncbi:Imm63 family immunity protein [Xanthomonas axonopodis pv. poinsettiicola]|uniref:Imm63 family immunity protein n=1 Tax=Xanthomonas TaxID=338 RepID=UPI001E5131FD|nr:Imm63 family immunity protein [Xanthomonas codiaei]MCC8535847.1 immunity 63 family protein [Xanthomonas codiaei]